MSASCCVAYIGLRFDIEITEVDALESGRDSRQIAAKSAGLDSYWSNFGGIEDRYVLLVGSKLAVLGPEDCANIQMSSERLSTLLSDTELRLRSVGLTAPATLNLEWLEDS